MKKNGGITLIALIVTVIILLILVGIVGYVFSKNGPIEHAQYSKFVTELRNIEEQVEMYEIEQKISKTSEEQLENMLPVGNKVTEEEKQIIRQHKTELEEKIKELSGKEIENIELYWIDQEKIGTSYKERYLIDVETKEIYQYEGQKIYGLMWHTVDEGIKMRKIQITITPPNEKVTQININIKYGSEGVKQYKIGKDNTSWSEYIGEITLTSEMVMENKWDNEDKTVTLYVKGMDDKGNEFIEEYVITNLDIDQPQIPDIKEPLIPKLTSNTGTNGKVTCSSFYEDGSWWDGWIAFNQRSHGDGWYAISSPAWIQYEFNNPTTVRRIYIYAEVGSSNSSMTGLTLQYSNDGINYQNIMNEYIYAIGNKTYIDIEEARIAKFWRLQFTKASRVYNLQFYGCEIELPEIPITINDDMIATIRFDSLYSQKLYKIDDGEWKDYRDTGIQLQIGQTIYVKGITKQGEEKQSSRVAILGPLIPKLTSNIGSNGKVTCSSRYGDGWDGWIAFNERSAGDGWYATSSPAWIQYEFNNPTKVRRMYIYAEIGSSNNSKTGLILQCSEDGVNYQNMMGEYTYTIGNKTYIDIEQPKTAKFWRLQFTNAVRVYNLQFYGI